MSHQRTRKLLVVDDDGGFRSAMSRALERRGVAVRAVPDGTSALTMQRVEEVDGVLLDLRLGGESGIELIERFLQRQPALVIVVLTAYGSIATAVEAIKAGAVDYLIKPVEPDSVIRAFGFRSDRTASQANSDTLSLRRLEWEHIQRVLAECDGNISATARRLGMHRRSLQRKLRKRPVER